jgi:hypothetical protein
MKTILSIILFILFMAALSSCGSNPYWLVYRHDGVEKRGYMKAHWPKDVTCSAYANNNRPVQRATWAKQYFWKPKK